MFSTLRTRFGIPGVISVIALVFALTGSAFAAKYIITSKSQIKPSVLNSLKGQKGAKGATGAQGSKGDTGAQGEKGSQGPEGKEGKEGPEGKEGKAGKDGTTGFTETLPPGKTETGVWDVTTPEPGIKFTTMSYNIPVPGVPAVKIVQAEETEVEGCPGTAEEPAAEPGTLCVYVLQTTLETVNAFPAFSLGTGADIGVSILGEGGGFARGTWAVTAE
jgi:hypothetical protein